ncbi:conserved protein of unknown function [Pararobbsia alpina]
MTVDNPAARLHQILKEALAHNPGEVCRDVWTSVLRVEPGDHPLLTRRLAEVMGLPREIAVGMTEHYPDETAMLSHWRGQVDSAFVKLHLAAQWNSFSSLIDAHAMNYLSNTAKMLQMVVAYKPADRPKLEEIRESIHALLSDVRNSDLDDALKLTVTRYLANLANSIDEYFITGVMPVLDAVNAACGRVLTDHDYRELLKGQTTIGEKIVEILENTAVVTTVAANLHELAPLLESGWKLLGGA